MIIYIVEMLVNTQNINYLYIYIYIYEYFNKKFNRVL